MCICDEMTSEIKISYADFPHICRLCFSTDNVSYIFLDSRTVNIFKFITNIKITESDTLPKNICLNCIEKLDDIYKFIEKCKSSDAILKALALQVEDEILLKDLQDEPDPITELLDENLPSDDVIQFKAEEGGDNVENIILEIIKEEVESDKEGENKAKVKEEALSWTNARGYPCTHCGKKFSRLALLQHHLYTHRDNTSLDCDKCNLTFPNLSALAKHRCWGIDKGPEVKGKLKRRRNDGYLCIYCNKNLTRKSDLQRHLRTHTGVKLFKCDICSKRFSQKCVLIRHTYLHTGKYKCKVCDKPFTRESQLEFHLAKGHPDESFQALTCKICGKKYGSKFYLKAHMKMHEDSSGFSCEICSRAFTVRSMLKRHYLSHVESKAFKCDVCNAAYKSKPLLERHKKCHEESEESQKLTCARCGKFFLFPSQLRRHERTHDPDRKAANESKPRPRPKPKVKVEPNKPEESNNTSKEFLCSYCGKQFSTKTKLMFHSKIHTGERYNCHICGKTYSLKDTLKTHLLAHKGEKPFPCPFCGKCFRRPSYYRHLLIHKGVRPHKCSICNKDFLRKDQLKQHMAVHQA